MPVSFPASRRPLRVQRRWPVRQHKADDKPKIWAADLRLTPNGKFLYSTERTLSKIALFSVAPGTGKLTYVDQFFDREAAARDQD